MFKVFSSRFPFFSFLDVKNIEGFPFWSVSFGKFWCKRPLCSRIQALGQYAAGHGTEACVQQALRPRILCSRLWAQDPSLYAAGFGR